MNKEILKWARLTSNLTVEEAAQKASVKEAQILAWEEGEDIPTYPQLEKLAYKVYNRPIAVFFFQKPPEEDVESSFRTLTENTIEDIPRNIKKILRVYKAFQLNLEELNHGTNPLLKNIRSLIPLKYGYSITSLSQEIRNILGINIDTQISWKSADDALQNWRDVIEKNGIYIFKDAFKEDDFSGFCLYDEEFPIIVLNNSSAKHRQIFTIFHELAHILFATSGIDRLSDDYLKFLKDENRKIEIYCNRLAADFLVPEAYFNELISGREINEKIISSLSSSFHVSKDVIARKLLIKNKITQSQYLTFSKKWNKEYLDSKDVKKRKKGGNHYNTKIQYLGKNYTIQVFRELYRGNISTNQAAEYLNAKINHIPQLETLVLK
ncbi:MAG: ImmA/IrrE family metallo-endopeptidase [Leptospiraceae bacterium]|nr:ImmA/IrrE family metallo-endopeptidase [Leptospiraceae bacterium]